MSNEDFLINKFENYREKAEEHGEPKERYGQFFIESSTRSVLTFVISI